MVHVRRHHVRLLVMVGRVLGILRVRSLLIGLLVIVLGLLLGIVG
jgi:hypothetical protein